MIPPYLMVILRIFLVSLVCLSAAPVRAQVPAPAPGAIPVPNTPFSLINNSTQWKLEVISADHIRLTGQVEIESGTQMKFFADEIDIFTDPNLRLVASGNVVFTNPEGRIAAERVEFNLDDGTGTFHQASGSLSLGITANRAEFGNQDPDIYFYGETIEKLSPRSYRLTRGGFTTCVQPTPRWEITSGSVVLNMNDYAIARNMLLRVKGVPLMYLPVIYYPIQDGDRATGFLLPTYGTSTLRGQTISNAFFWAMGRSHDATFYHDWYTRTGQGAGAEYRYIAGQQSYGNFRFYRLQQRETEFAQSGRTTVLAAKNMYQLMGFASQGLGQAVRAQERVDFSTDIVTQQLYHQNLYQASNPSRSIDAGISGVWGGFATSALYQRTETFSTLQSSNVYGSTPRVTAAFAPRRMFGLPVYGSVNSEYAFLPYRNLTDGVTTSDRSLGRFDVLPSVRVPLSGLTFMTLNANASYRVTRYSRDTSGADTPLLRRYFTSRLDIIGPVFTKVWDTPESTRSERMKHVIEPTFTFDYVTSIDNYNKVPVLTDTTDFVVSGAMRFTYGLNNRLFSRARTPDGLRGQTREFVTVGVYQTYYSKPESSRYDTSTYSSAAGRPNLVDLSPVALLVGVSPTPTVNLNARFEYDVSPGGVGLQVFSTSGRMGAGASNTTASYSRIRYAKSSLYTDYLTTSTALSFLQNRVTGSYSLSWDVAHSYVVSQSVTASYLAQCCGLKTEFQRFSFPQGSGFPINADRRFNVSFVLAGLGTFSNFFGAFGLGQ